MSAAASAIRDHIAAKPWSKAAGERRFGRGPGVVSPFRTARNSGSSGRTRISLAGLAPRPLRFPAVMPIVSQLAAL